MVFISIDSLLHSKLFNCKGKKCFTFIFIQHLSKYIAAIEHFEKEGKYSFYSHKAASLQWHSKIFFLGFFHDLKCFIWSWQESIRDDVSTVLGTDEMYLLLVLLDRREKGCTQGYSGSNLKQVMKSPSPPLQFVIPHNFTFNSLSSYLIKTLIKKKTMFSSVQRLTGMIHQREHLPNLDQE